MNIYGVDVGDIEYIEMIDYEANVGFSYTNHEVCIVAAETRGQARAIATHNFNLEYTDKVSIRLLEKGVDRRIGLICDGVHYEEEYYLWWLFGRAFYPNSTPDYSVYVRQIQYGYDEFTTESE